MVWLTYSWLKKSTFTQTPTNNNNSTHSHTCIYTHTTIRLQLNAQCNKQRNHMLCVCVFGCFALRKGSCCIITNSKNSVNVVLSFVVFFLFSFTSKSRKYKSISVQKIVTFLLLVLFHFIFFSFIPIPQRYICSPSILVH